MESVTILIGCSGAGKSTWIKNNMPDAVVCSADSYFMINGEYRFDPRLLPKAHAQSLRYYARILPELHKADVIVDNTNSTLVEAAPYVALAEAYGFKPTVLVFDVHPKLAHARNTHNVPLSTIERQCTQIIKMLNDWPRRWPQPVYM